MRGVRGYTLLLTGLLIAIAFVLQGCPSLIANRPPNAEFTAKPTSGTAPLTVSFDASTSSDPDKDNPDGDIVSYEWEFGDGDTATGKTVDHTYSAQGTYEARLTVTDGQGATDTDSTMISVGKSPAHSDVVFATIQKPNQACLGDGTGSFNCSDMSSNKQNSVNVALGDVNEDGHMDAVFAHIIPGGGSTSNRVCLGDGAGGFNCSDLASAANESRDVALGDLNQDGHLDAVFANADPTEQNQVCLGDGKAGFICSSFSGRNETTHGVAIGKFNRDMHLDIVLANRFGDANRVCLGDGTGSFNCSSISGASYDSFDAEVADLNSDGHDDLVFSNAQFGSTADGSSPNRVCLGDGAGSFSCNNVSGNDHDSLNVSLGDVNGDGNVDAAFANNSVFTNPDSTIDQQNRICLGDGSGGFSCSPISSDNSDTRGIALGDFTGDQQLDAVIANSGPPSRRCIGNGNGGFSCADLSTETTPSHEVTIGEVGE